MQSAPHLPLWSRETAVSGGCGRSEAAPCEFIEEAHGRPEWRGLSLHRPFDRRREIVLDDNATFTTALPG